MENLNDDELETSTSNNKTDIVSYDDNEESDNEKDVDESNEWFVET